MLTLDWTRPGLVWFYKMDRNRDGDVSAQEFLGPAVGVGGAVVAT